MTTESFHYRFDDGREITLPHLRNVKAGVIRRNRHLSIDNQMWAVIEAVADDDALALIDDLEGHQLEAMSEAWQKASVQLGESSASSGS